LRCRIRGALQIKNQNTQNAQTSRLKFYLSSDSTFDSSDTLLKDIAAGPLKAGRTKTKILRASLPIGSSASGKHVIALVDATNAVAETDETNNEIVSGALP
jgi:subtilase family serine protease